MLINSTIGKSMFVVLAVILIMPAIAPAISPKIAEKEIINNEKEIKVTQKKFVPCKVFTPEGVYGAKQRISVNELKNLKSMLNETIEAIKILNDKNATIEEIEYANGIIHKSAIELKRLGLIPDETSVNDIIKLLKGEDRIKLNINNEFLSKFEKANIGCFVLGKGQTVCGRLYFLILDELNNYLHKNYPKLAELIENIQDTLYKIDRKIPSMFSLLLAFSTFGGGGPIYLEVTGLLGSWNLYGAVDGVMIGFTGIWTADLIIGYASFIGIYFYNPYPT